MACGKYTLKGLNSRCKVSTLGGIKEVYIANYDEVLSTSVDSGTTLLTPTMYPGKKFKVYSLNKNNGSLSISMVYTPTMANYYVNTLSLSIPKMDVGNRIEMMSIMDAQMAVIIRDSNDKYWYLGKDSYVEATVGAGNTGQALDDTNNYSFSLQDTSKELPFEVDAECIPNIIDNGEYTSDYLEMIYYVLTGEESPYQSDEELTNQIIILIRELMDVATFAEIDMIFDGISN